MQITIYKLYEFFGSSDFQRELDEALREAGIFTVAILQDDARVEHAALMIYENLPVYVRAIVGVTLGMEGFVSFIFRLRDRLIANGQLDLSWLDIEQIRIIILAQLNKQDFSNHIWVFTGQITDGRSIVFEFRGPTRQTPDVPFRTSYLVGRSPDFCHIVIPDMRISRKHAEIGYFPNHGLCIRDLNSTNGTWLNGMKMDAEYKPFAYGAELALGELRLKVSTGT